MGISSKSKKGGVLLTYFLIVAQALSTMILTRFYLDSLGSEAYGLYQMIYSVAQYILILDLGISTVMVRYISEFDSKNEKVKSENFAFHFSLIVVVLSVIVFFIGIILNANIENIYRNLSADEYELSHRIFNIMIIQIIATIVSHYFNGILEAYEHFVFSRFLSVLQIVLNVFLSIVFLKSGMGTMGIVLSNTIVIVVKLLISMGYDLWVIRFKIRFHYWDFDLLRPVSLLMCAMLLQAITGHVNSSVDKTILGIMCEKKDVTVYSLGATIVTMFNTLPSTVSSVFQPSVTRLVTNGISGDKLTDIVAKLGRIQFMIIGGFIAGFVVAGRDFIACWGGVDKLDAWQYVLLIIVPNAVPLMQNICLAILNAMDKRIYRSIILTGITALNIVLTIILIQLVGPIGAPLATGVSYLIGHCILMNVYYQKVIGLSIGRMFAEITRRTAVCVIAAALATAPFMLWKNDGNWLIFLAKISVFCIIYALLLWLYGMNDYEHGLVRLFLKKFISKST